MRKSLIVVIAFLGLAGALWLFGVVKTPNMPTSKEVFSPTFKPQETPARYVRPVINTADETNPRFVKTLEKSSLRGTDVDRAHVPINEDGSFQLTPAILVYFDYFLSLRGEMSLARIKQIIWDDIHQNYSEQLANYLYDLFIRYLQYSDAIDAYLNQLSHAQIVFQGITEQQIEQQFQPQYFTNDEIHDIFNAYKKMIAFTSQGKIMEEKMKQYRETPVDERFAVATELFGAEAAGRLQALEQQRSIWQQRLTEYQQQKNAILQSGLDKAGQEAAIQELLDRSFTAQEKVRVRTLEKPQ